MHPKKITAAVCLLELTAAAGSYLSGCSWTVPAVYGYGALSCGLEHTDPGDTEKQTVGSSAGTRDEGAFYVYDHLHRGV